MTNGTQDEHPKEVATDDGRGFRKKRGIPYFDEVIQDIRKRYNIPKNLKVYLYIGYNFATRISQFEYTKVNFEQLNEDKGKLERFRVDGIIEKKNYRLVSIRIGDDYYFILFTNDLKSFEKDYFKTKISPRKGLFRIMHTCFGAILIRVDITNVTEPILNKNLFSELTDEINNFMGKETVYKKYHLDYKRGLLLYGLPGNGKTCFIKHLLKEVDAISIIVDAKNEQDLDFVYNFLGDKDTWDYHKIIVLEDIDRVSNEHVRSRFLNLIDGIVSLNRTLFIATSNNPKNLDYALTNRPSRFDSLYEIESPNKESRIKLIKSFFPKVTDEEMKEALKLTEDFRGAHFKEVFLITQLDNRNMIDAIKRLKEKFKAFKDFTKDTDYLG